METLTLDRLGFQTSSWQNENVQAAYGQLIDAQVKELSYIIDQVKEKETSVNNDQGLKPRGKVDRINQIKEYARQEIGKLAEARRRKLDVDLEAAKQNLPQRIPMPSPEQTPHMLVRLDHREIREYLRGMSELERDAAVLSAGETGDVDTLLAVQEAKPIVRPVSDKTFEQAKQRWLEHAYPEAYAAVSSAESALSTYNSNINRALQWIANTTPGDYKATVVDPVQQTAAAA